MSSVSLASYQQPTCLICRSRCVCVCLRCVYMCVFICLLACVCLCASVTYTHTHTHHMFADACVVQWHCGHVYAAGHQSHLQLQVLCSTAHTGESNVCINHCLLLLMCVGSVFKSLLISVSVTAKAICICKSCASLSIISLTHIHTHACSVESSIPHTGRVTAGQGQQKSGSPVSRCVNFDLVFSLLFCDVCAMH